VDKERLFEVISLDDLAEEEEYLDRSKLRDDVQALAEFYADYGYAFAEADYVLDVDKENLLVGVSYNLYKHRKVYIRRLLITGNTDTRDNVIRREMRLSDGEVFRSSALERSTERLEKTGYFEQVSIEPVRTENQDEMDLLVKVKEQSTGELSGGVGYSTFTRFYVTSSITERNLFGKGYKISLGTSLGGSSNSFNFSFVNPNVYDTPLAFSTNLYLQTADFGDFSKDTIGGVVGLGYPVGEYTSVGISYRLDRYRVHEVDDNAADAIEEAEGTNWSSAMALSATRDTLNSRVDPTDGSKNTLSIEYAGGILMGDDDFIKYIYDTSQYYPLPWFSHVFHFHGQAGIVTKNLSDDEVPVFERFFLGGMNSIRGYTHGRIAPYDEETGDRIGGTKQFFANFEYIFPLYTEFGLKGLVFFDAGDAFTEYEEFDIKKSVGAGIRWLSPMGLLRLEYGYALDEIREQGNRGKFEFSVGQSF
jgi:outer membrane protein insertion porin family